MQNPFDTPEDTQVLVDKEVLQKVMEYEAVLRTIAQAGSTVADNARLCKNVLEQFNVPLKVTLF